MLVPVFRGKTTDGGEYVTLYHHRVRETELFIRPPGEEAQIFKLVDGDTVHMWNTLGSHEFYMRIESAYWTGVIKASKKDLIEIGKI